MGSGLIKNRANNNLAKNPTLLRNRNQFPYECTITTNLNMGEITPIKCLEVSPGQTLDLDLTSLVRLAPTITPTMDNLILKTFAFYVPSRQCWKHFPQFMGQIDYPENPEKNIEYQMPTINTGNNGIAVNSLGDHLGLPINVPNLEVTRLPFDAHNRIYNYYFRNQKVENMKWEDDGDQNGDINNYDIYTISKARDYFTSCLPDQSSGEPVRLPIGTTAPILPKKAETAGNQAQYFKLVDKNYNTINNNTGLLVGKPGITSAGGLTSLNNPVMTGHIVNADGGGGAYVPENNWLVMNPESIYADLTGALGADIVAVRQAIALQEYNELNNRGGNRYFEQLANRYGTINPDLILQNPEYLGGTTKLININPVTQTSATIEQTTGAGNLTGYGFGLDSGKILNKSFGEWGYVIIYAVITKYNKYQQGTHKMWKRLDKLDYWAPEFALIGDEPVYNYEIFTQGGNVINNETGNQVDEEVFGYNERYGSYKYAINEIHGVQRSTANQSLDYNHLAEEFDNLPKLNKTFDKLDKDTIKRILQVTDDVRANSAQFFADFEITGKNYIGLPIDPVPAISYRIGNFT